MCVDVSTLRETADLVCYDVRRADALGFVPTSLSRDRVTSCGIVLRR